MTEYIIIVALIAVAAIGVYQTFGTIVRSQTAVAAATLGGQKAGGSRNISDAAAKDSENRGKSKKDLTDFEKDSFK